MDFIINSVPAVIRISSSPGTAVMFSIYDWLNQFLCVGFLLFIFIIKSVFPGKADYFFSVVEKNSLTFIN